MLWGDHHCLQVVYSDLLILVLIIVWSVLVLLIRWSVSDKGKFSSLASFRPEDGPEGKYSQRSYSQSREIYVVSLVGPYLSNYPKLKVLWRPVPN